MTENAPVPSVIKLALYGVSVMRAHPTRALAGGLICVAGGAAGIWLLQYLVMTYAEPGSGFFRPSGMRVSVNGVSGYVPGVWVGVVSLILGLVSLGVFSGWIRFFSHPTASWIPFRFRRHELVASLFIGLWAAVFAVLAIGVGGFFVGVITMPVVGQIIGLAVSLWLQYLGMRITLAVAIIVSSITPSMRAGWNGGHGWAIRAFAAQLLLAAPFAVAVLILGGPANFLHIFLGLVSNLLSTGAWSGALWVGATTGSLFAFLPVFLVGALMIAAVQAWLMAAIGPIVCVAERRVGEAEKGPGAT